MVLHSVGCGRVSHCHPSKLNTVWGVSTKTKQRFIVDTPHTHTHNKTSHNTRTHKTQFPEFVSVAHAASHNTPTPGRKQRTSSLVAINNKERGRFIHLTAIHVLYGGCGGSSGFGGGVCEVSVIRRCPPRVWRAPPGRVFAQVAQNYRLLYASSAKLLFLCVSSAKASFFAQVAQNYRLLYVARATSPHTSALQIAGRRRARGLPSLHAPRFLLRRHGEAGAQ